MIKSNTRASLIKFLQILVAHHPSKRYRSSLLIFILLGRLATLYDTQDFYIRCRKGSAEILVNIDDLLPSELVLGDKQEENDGKGPLGAFQICGKNIPRGYWVGTWTSVVHLDYPIVYSFSLQPLC